LVNKNLACLQAIKAAEIKQARQSFSQLWQKWKYGKNFPIHTVICLLAALT